jgi:glutamate synthase domain-containing protein 3
MVDIEPVVAAQEQQKLYEIICNHVNYTGSEYAGRIVRDWAALVPQFVRIMPAEYRRALERLKKAESKETDVVALTEEVFR